MLRLAHRIEDNFTVMPKTSEALKNIYVPYRYIKLYGTRNKADIFVGEALNLRKAVIAFHTGTKSNMLDHFSYKEIKDIDTAISAVINATNNFFDAINIITK